MIRTLIVDDDFRVAALHAKFVTRTDGFEVVGTANSGRDALSAVADLTPDLVLLDVYLPDINGLELLRQWRTAMSPVGVIVITAAREARAVRAALAGGATHYLIKPFEYEELAAALKRFQQQRSLVDQLSSASQADVDKIFVPASHRNETRPLPKGLNTETAEIVRTALEHAPELSAAECSDQIGISRVSVRRYLEYFTQEGIAAVRLEYGRPGRPTRRYRLL